MKIKMDSVYICTASFRRTIDNVVYIPLTEEEKKTLGVEHIQNACLKIYAESEEE